MGTIYYLIPIAIIFTAIGIYLFFWAVKSEQFDDLEKQGMSILFDDEEKSSTLEVMTNEVKNKDNDDNCTSSKIKINK